MHQQPLSAPKPHPDAAATTSAHPHSAIDMPSAEASVVDVPVATVDVLPSRTDVHADVGSPPVDAASDQASDHGGAGETLPIDEPSVGVGSNDVGPPSDGGRCPGNGREPHGKRLGIAFTIEGNQPNSRLGLFSWSPGTSGFADPTYQNAYDIPDSIVVADVDGDGPTSI